jgi:GNAT superfamily N-acetyltransferase
MSLEWIKESPPYWDGDKAAVVGGAPDGIFEISSYNDGDLIAAEWWRVEEAGTVLGYGWMDHTWGDAEILLVVGEEARGRGVGTFILDRLEEEARDRGLNYMFNVVRPTHPDREGVTRWLEGRGFKASEDGLLKRQVAPPGK